MKCPIRYNVWVDKDNKPILLDQDCLKEECAWWDSDLTRCVMLSIPTYLNTLDRSLNNLAKELTLK